MEAPRARAEEEPIPNIQGAIKAKEFSAKGKMGTEEAEGDIRKGRYHFSHRDMGATCPHPIPCLQAPGPGWASDKAGEEMSFRYPWALLLERGTGRWLGRF